MKPYEISRVQADSILDEMSVEGGDLILTINGRPVYDELDLHYLSTDEFLTIEVQKKSGEIWELDIEKDEDEELGIVQCQAQGIRQCKNKCVFCFIDQLPKGMRNTLYIKDDDERLSFLQGNYITLTNLTEAERKRIVDYRIMPINISVHTTNPELRMKMLKNPKSKNINEDLDFFSKNNIQMNGQIVLCPGYNDGSELERTLKDLMTYHPALSSVSVVPIGLSKHRENLEKIESVTLEKARETISIIEQVQNHMLIKHQTRFVFPSDEFYLLAQLPIPSDDTYEGYPQLENGVGMLSDLKTTLEFGLEENKVSIIREHNYGIITGTLASSFMLDMASKIMKAYPEIHINVYPIRNCYFGETITVSGLVTGKDILEQVPANLGETYLIPENMVKFQTRLLLDDITVDEIEKKLNAEIEIVAVDGNALLRAILKNRS